MGNRGAWARTLNHGLRAQYPEEPLDGVLADRDKLCRREFREAGITTTTPEELILTDEELKALEDISQILASRH